MLTNNKSRTSSDANPVAFLNHTGAFITVWDTHKMQSGTFAIPSEGINYEYYWEKVGYEASINSGSYQVDSGDLVLSGIVPGTGIYRLYIKGAYRRICMNMGTTDKPLTAGVALALTAVESWGDIEWENMRFAFAGCQNLTNLPLTAPDLRKVADMGGMFIAACKLSHDMSNWDVSQVSDMTAVFAGATMFNGNIRSWDVSNVTVMAGMFQRAKLFNQDIGTWDVAKVTDMMMMFDGAELFNQNIASWNVENVTDMNRMFKGTLVFNQDIGSWNVSKVVSMKSMFEGAINFNQPLDKWNVSKVIDMSDMFKGAQKTEVKRG